MKVSKRLPTKLFLLLTFLLVWAIFAGNFANGDFEHYERDFNVGGLDRLEDVGIEPLYTFLILFLKAIYNFKDFIEFKAVIAFFFMIPYWCAVYKWSRNPALTILFFAPIFLLQVVILRNFMAFSIMTFAIPLFSNPTKKNLVLFGFLVLIAEGLHNMMFVYLLCYLLICNLKILNHPLRYYAICLIIGFVLGGLLFAFMVSSSVKYNDTESQGLNYLRMAFGVVLVINYYMLRLINKQTKDSENTRIRSFEEMVVKMNFIFIGLTVLFAISVVAARLFVNLLLFNIIYVANRMSRGPRKGGVVPVSAPLYVFFWIYYVLIITLSVQLEDIFKYNYFIMYLFS